MRQVVVTGIGASTPLGGDAPTTWAALRQGTSAARRLDHDWAAQIASQIAAPAAVDPSTLVEPAVARRIDRGTQFALIAGLAAWRDAGFEPDEPDRDGPDRAVDPDRLAVVAGAGMGGLHSVLDQWDTYRDRGPRRVSPFTVPMLMANAPAANLGLRLGARAAVHAPVSACASGSDAIAWGLDMLRLGRADVAVAGGGDATIHPLGMAAFSAMSAMSRRNDDPQHASRPWDVQRDGFVMGEGAAFVVLETLEHAQARGARIYGTLAGAGVSADSHDVVQPDASGAGLAAAMRRGLIDADLAAADIDHINAHATSTPQGDIAEARAIRTALGGACEHVVVTATKSQTGHLLGGAGALESVATILALRDRLVPPTINIEELEPGLGLDIATQPRKLPDRDLAAINLSSGFGGHNVALIHTTQHATVPGD